MRLLLSGLLAFVAVVAIYTAVPVAVVYALHQLFIMGASFWATIISSIGLLIVQFVSGYIVLGFAGVIGYSKAKQNIFKRK